MEPVVYFYQYVIFFYSISLTSMYIMLAILGYVNIRRKKFKYTKKEEELFNQYPEKAPGISIVIPAYNEEVIIIDNVRSILNLDYPNFELVVVNDGSKDSTLDLLIDTFALKEVPFDYIYKVRCQTVKRILKSTDPKYQQITVIDKVNGGTKADAMNAGVNYIKYEYFINTDVDCILARDTLKKVILPVLDSDTTVIAVGATMRMVNGCNVNEGILSRVKPPRTLVPTFQETEYLRSYLVAKMGWSSLNAIPNVSGGFGFFNTQIVINVGGFDPLSHAEDMDMTTRMVAYMRERGEKYKIDQIPDSCCWTQGPSNIEVLHRQRTRWGRGLMQIFVIHRRLIFNRRYGRLGLLVLPYAFVFEFLAPIIEAVGGLFLLFLLFTQQINFATFWFMLLFVYLVSVTVSMITISYDLTVRKQYKTIGEYMWLVLFSSFEAFLYHPFIVFFSLKGYLQFFTHKDFKWGNMTRQGFTSTKRTVN